MSLVTLNDVKERLGIDLLDLSQDSYLSSEISIFDSIIKNYCNNVLEQTTVTEIIYYDDFKSEKEHSLYYFPIVGITSINEKHPDSLDVSITDYRLNKRTGLLSLIHSENFYKENLFTNYGQGASLEIVYEAGYAVVPPEIEEVVYSLIEERYNKKQSGVALNFGNNIQRLSIPGVMSIDYDYTLNTNERKNKYGMIIGDYSNVLDLFCSERTIMGDRSEIYLG